MTKVLLAVTNSGEGAALKAAAALELGSPDIFASGDTAASLGTLEAGQTKRLEFQFVVNNRFKGKALPVRVELSAGRFRSKAPLNLALGEPPAELNVVTVKGKDAAPAAAASAEANPDLRIFLRPRGSGPQVESSLPRAGRWRPKLP